MSRTLLLCFIHGFKGDDDTFHSFPEDLKVKVSEQLPDHRVETVVYPKYETKGELGECTVNFLEWLKERVMDIRKVQCEKPWPPHDRNVGVILVAHSMGGFVASDALFHILNERRTSESPSSPLFPLIQGIIAFDTPYNGLSRSMFVYGAFSNYDKVSNVFNVMTALSAGPVALGRLAMDKAKKSVPLAARSTASTPSSSRSPGWKAWQLVAVRTGTVGAIAAGGVLAYTHRKQIMDGMRAVRNINKQTIVEGYNSSVDALGQGLAYINRGNVGESFAWLSDHFTFVGVLLKQKELSKRLERLVALKGIGVHDVYASMGENGYWSGGYFVPERTFCAIPDAEHGAAKVFERLVIKTAEDEIQAHVNMFQPGKNPAYSDMTASAATRIIDWFNADEEIFDDPAFSTPDSEPDAVEDKIKPTTDGVDAATVETIAPDTDAVTASEAEDLPDESPLDIAAAASLVPLPDDNDDDSLAKVSPEQQQKATYMRHLFGVAQQAGTGLKRVSQWGTDLPTKMPRLDGFGKGLPVLPKPAMPTMPSMPTMPTMPSMPSMPGVNLFGKKPATPAPEEGEKTAEGEKAGDAKGAADGEEVGPGEKPADGSEKIAEAEDREQEKAVTGVDQVVTDGKVKEPESTANTQ